MKKIKTIIVDDEFAARNIIKQLLEMTYPNIEVIATAEDLLEAVALIKEHKPDLVFLDVEMPNYAGYEISKFFEKIDFHIVFVTAYNQYAIKAFEICAVDYLLKPIDRKRLGEAIVKVEIKIKDKAVYTDYKTLVNEIENKENKAITFTESGKKHIVKIKNIIAISAQGSYSEIFLEEGKNLLISKNIGILVKDLEEEKCFFRTHKSWIVNKDFLISLEAKNNIIALEFGVEAKLSRYKKEEFEAFLKE